MGNGSLQGYKTYIVAGLAILGAIAGYFTGDLDLAGALQTGVAAIGAMTMRAGIEKSGS